MNRRPLALAAMGGALAACWVRRAAAQPVNLALDPTEAQALGAMAFAEATSQVAIGNAQFPAVRSFAQLEAEEQQAFAAARSMAGLPVPQPQMMDAQKQAMLQQLSALSGPQFDAMYLQGQVAGHQELLQLNTAMAQSAPTREQRILGTVAVPAIRSHLLMLSGISQAMRG